ncbi:lysophospholipase L1-like esterase [Nocardioides daedukensis]|uniref:Lysophospholipase L1-like esterase n=1 Tax=Nocardioides daedukensis TaxID=634462 RepID=A0A7Y9S153_9ACTN|nr:SGNH/GDSL hydrolase family protein [Nocardioides daedukensis]NYG60412.1 lysophospholipase L1-like esterase [Nocardioides daedukensis]
MKHTSLRLVSAAAVLPMLLAAGVVSSAADEARRTSNADGSRVSAASQELDAAAAKALAAKAESLSASQSAKAPTSAGVGHPKATGTKATAAAKAKAPAKKPLVYKEYVSLGDSWSADVKLIDAHGLPDARHAPIDCAQSQVNYPKLLAAALKVKIHRDATCGSATTDDFYAPQTAFIGGTNPPQFDRLTKKTDLVTIGIGGNDASVAAAALDCLNVLPVNVPVPLPALDLGLPLVPSALPLGGCKERFTAGGVDQLAVAIKASEPKLIRAIKDVRKRSPKARILMVDYLAAVPPKTCYPFLPMTESDRAYLAKAFRSLNAMVKSAARKGGAEFVDTYTPSLGHDVCAALDKRYVEVVGVSVNDLGIGIPAHPNSAGARAQFRAVLKQVNKR